MKRPYFKEEQKMDRNILILLLVSGCITMTMVLVATLTEQKSDQTELIIVILGLMAIYGFIFWLMNTMKLYTKVDMEGIHMRYPPFRRSWRTFSFSDIQNLEVKKGKLLKDFGGWGYGKGFGKKKSYTTKGDHGVLMQLKDGKKIFIGTQEPKMLERALQKVRYDGEGA